MSRVSGFRPSGRQDYDRPPRFLYHAALTACLAGSLGVSTASAQTAPAASPQASQQPITTATSISQEVKGVFERGGASVVKIRGFDEHSEIRGTGFFIDPTGTLYTSYTVGGEADNFTVEFNGKEYPAKQIVADVRSGVAILKVEDVATPALPIGKASDLEVATPVVSIGFPLDLPKTPSFGMIGGFDRKYMGRYFPTTLLRVNLPVQRGEAGAPLLNLKGEVVGMLVSSLENNSCYALPIDAAEKIRGDFVRFGEVRHGWIGANVTEAKTSLEGSRVETTDILPGTPAADSGIKKGDVVLQIGRTKVHEPEDVLDASFYITAGDTIPIVVKRGDETLTFNVQADFQRPSRAIEPPRYPDGHELPMNAEAPQNRSIPLSLQYVPQGRP